MTDQEILDSIVIGQSPLTGEIYIGLPDKKHPGQFRCKSSFTNRLKEFAP